MLHVHHSPSYCCSSGVLQQLYVVWDARFEPSQLSCLGSLAGRAVCLEYGWHGFESHPRQFKFHFRKVTALGVLRCFALLLCLTSLLSASLINTRMDTCKCICTCEFFFLHSLLFATSFFLSISEKCSYIRDCSCTCSSHSSAGRKCSRASQ